MGVKLPLNVQRSQKLSLAETLPFDFFPSLPDLSRYPSPLLLCICSCPCLIFGSNLPYRLIRLRILLQFFDKIVKIFLLALSVLQRSSLQLRIIALTRGQ